MSSRAENDLTTRIIFTFLALVVCRIGSYIPVAGINSAALQDLYSQNQGGILGMFNMLSGGSLGRMSIFALAIMPYITSSIVIQLSTMAYKPLENLKKEGEIGRRKISQITKYCTIILAALQAYGIAVGLENLSGSNGSIVVISPSVFRLTAVVTFTVGTMFLVWLGEQITARGIGNGSSLIIFVGIVSGIPSAIISTFELTRKGGLSPVISIGVCFSMVIMIAIIIFFERAQRRVLVQYPKRQVGNKIYGGDATHMPLKLNTAGVIPPIFAGALLGFPVTIASFSGETSGIMQSILYYLGRGKPLFVILYTILIMVFCFFYTAVVFNAEETSNNLRKYGAYIPGRRPGKDTADYFDYLLTRLTVVGALYLCFICIVPEIFMNNIAVAASLGGTSLLIVVNVVIDTFSQIQTHMFSTRYEGLMRKMKSKDR